MDWTGSTAQRRKDRDACLYPNAKPTPRAKEYFVSEGISALCKKVRDREWMPYTTTKPLAFDSIYRQTDKSFIFFSVGYLLCVNKHFVTTEKPNVRPPRSGDAPEKLTEDLDREYREIVQ